jgi:hypothetical protein
MKQQSIDALLGKDALIEIDLAHAGDQLENLGASAARAMISFYRIPENQAAFAGIFLTEGFLLAIAPKTRFLPSVLLGICGGLVAREAYLAARNIREIAKAVKDAADTAIA